MSNKKTTPIIATVGAAFIASAMLASVAANANPFQADDLASGYNVGAEGSCGEGKCGGHSHDKEGEGSCGEKSGEGSCGGDKAAEGSCGEEGKTGEGSCGEGKCGGDKAAEGACGESKTGEGSCGEGKCGGNK